MRTVYLFLVLILFSSLTVWAGDFTPLNVKEGLWEVTVTHTMTGMPAVNIPADAMAKMPPEQRARMEAMMKGGASTDVRKECITKEKLEKQSAFSDDRKECTHTVLNSTSSKLEMKIHCKGEEQGSMDGTLLVEAIGSDNVKGKMQAVTNANGKTMNMNFTFSSRYLGPACGDVK